MKEGIEITGRRGRRRKQLLKGFKEETGYWNLNQEALDGTAWRTSFGKYYGTVVRIRNKLLRLSVFQFLNNQKPVVHKAMRI